jgi:hypothetical protein
MHYNSSFLLDVSPSSRCMTVVVVLHHAGVPIVHTHERVLSVAGSE